MVTLGSSRNEEEPRLGLGSGLSTVMIVRGNVLILPPTNRPNRLVHSQYARLLALLEQIDLVRE